MSCGQGAGVGRGPSGAHAQRDLGGGGGVESCVVGQELKMGTNRQARVDGVGLRTGGGRAGRMRAESGPRGQRDGLGIA